MAAQHLREQIAQLDDDDLLDTASALLEAHIQEAMRHGMPGEALHLAALSIGLTALQAEHGPHWLGALLSGMSESLIKRSVGGHA